jgi:hypothetical protein
MKSKAPVPNHIIMEILDLLDTTSIESKPVQFRFSALEEGLLYRLASVLKKRGYQIRLEKPSANRWICIAIYDWHQDSEPLDRHCIRMVHLADKYEVLFEGWETVFKGKKSVK